MPRQRPGRSEQTVGTPPDLVLAVERRFGPIRLDLAATTDNRVVPMYMGPGGFAEDALAPTVGWHHHAGNLWLNPPFGNIRPWAAKCAAEAELGAAILLLVPYTVADWFRDHVHRRALVLALSPRVKFVGHTTGYPAGLQLCVFGPLVAPGWDVWRWKS